MSLTPEKTRELTVKFGASESDTGNTRVQIALLTERINALTEHLRSAQEGPPLAAWPAHARRPAPAVAQLPAQEGPRGLPGAHQGARSPPLTTCRARHAPTSLSVTRPGRRRRAPSCAAIPSSWSSIRPPGPPGLHRPAPPLPGRDERLRAQGARSSGSPATPPSSHKAFRDPLGIDFPQLADFEPKGEVVAQVRHVLRRARARRARLRRDRPGREGQAPRTSRRRRSRSQQRA